MGSRPAIEERRVSGVMCLYSYQIVLRRYSGVRGGGSVRRRNALHEVGGRSIRTTTRVLKARAGRETHTHINLSHSSYAHKIKS